MAAVAAARAKPARWPTTTTVGRWNRSATAPAGPASSSAGRKDDAVATPAPIGDPVMRSMARAAATVWSQEPVAEIVPAVQKAA
jgi:hypothetical protein